MTAGEVFSSIGNWFATHPGTVFILFLVILAAVVICTWVGTNWPAIKALGATLVAGAQIVVFAAIAAALLGITTVTIAITYKLYKWAKGKSDAAKSDAESKASDARDSSKSLAESDFEVVANDPTSTPEQVAAAQTALDQANADADAAFATAMGNAQAAYEAGMAHMADILGANGAGRRAIEQASQNAQGGGSAAGSSDLVITMSDGTQKTLSIEDISDGLDAEDDEFFDVLDDNEFEGDDGEANLPDLIELDDDTVVD